MVSGIGVSRFLIGINVLVEGSGRGEDSSFSSSLSSSSVSRDMVGFDLPLLLDVVGGGQVALMRKG